MLSASMKAGMLSSGKRWIRKPGEVRNTGVAEVDDAAGALPWLPWAWTAPAATLTAERINHRTLRTSENSPF